MKHPKVIFHFVLIITCFYVVWKVYEINIELDKLEKAVISLQNIASTPNIDKDEKTKAQVKIEHKELEWPHTTAPDTTDPYWKLNNNLSINGVAYHKVDMGKGKWEWRENDAINNSIRNEENHRRELMQALQSRVLTDKEMDEVNSYGRDLNIYNMEPFIPEDKQRELNEALLQQFRLRQRHGN